MAHHAGQPIPVAPTGRQAAARRRHAYSPAGQVHTPTRSIATTGDPLQLLFLALDAAAYPTLLAAVVIVLNQPRRVPLLSAYLAAGLIVSAGVGARKNGSPPDRRR